MAEVACALVTVACAADSSADRALICAAAASAAACACWTWVSDGRRGAADAGPASTPRVRAAVRMAPSAVPTERPGTLRARTEPTSDLGPDVRIHVQALDRQDGGRRTALRRASHPNESATEEFGVRRGRIPDGGTRPRRTPNRSVHLALR